MIAKLPALLLLLAANAYAFQLPLPQLRVEATNAGSVLHVKNDSGQALTAFLIELVDYPGSSFSFWQDDAAGTPLASGEERAYPITNMTVGAAPEYVQMRAAVYADGGTAGLPEKVEKLIERRRHSLETTRELIRRFEQTKAEGKSKEAIAAELNQWADSMPAVKRSERNSQRAINQTAATELITEAVSRLGADSLDAALAALRDAECLLAASKPELVRSGNP